MSFFEKTSSFKLNADLNMLIDDILAKSEEYDSRSHVIRSAIIKLHKEVVREC